MAVAFRRHTLLHWTTASMPNGRQFHTSHDLLWIVAISFEGVPFPKDLIFHAV